MDNEQLSLKRYLDLCVEFENDSTPENQDKISFFLSQLQIKEYMTLKDKAITAMAILVDVQDDFDAMGSANFIEFGKMFHGLCAYAINLQNDIYPLDKTFAAYDLCMKYGLFDSILCHCERDYMRLCNYIDNVINASNIYRLIQTASLLNNTEYEKWVQSMKELRDTLTPEFMKSIEEINVTNSASTKNLIELLAAKSIDDTNKALIADEYKYGHIASDIDTKFNLADDAEDK